MKSFSQLANLIDFDKFRSWHFNFMNHKPFHLTEGFVHRTSSLCSGLSESGRTQKIETISQIAFGFKVKAGVEFKIELQMIGYLFFPGQKFKGSLNLRCQGNADFQATP